MRRSKSKAASMGGFFVSNRPRAGILLPASERPLLLSEADIRVEGLLVRPQHPPDVASGLLLGSIQRAVDLQAEWLRGSPVATSEFAEEISSAIFTVSRPTLAKSLILLRGTKFACRACVYRRIGRTWGCGDEISLRVIWCSVLEFRCRSSTCAGKRWF